MTAEGPSDAELQRLLDEAAAKSAHNAGADDIAAYRMQLRARARRRANASISYDMVGTFFLVLLVIIVALAFHSAFTVG